MMKVLLMIIGFLVLCIVGIGSMGWYAMNQKIDPNTEKGQVYSQSFKASIEANCTRGVARSVGFAARGEELQDMCACAAEMTLKPTRICHRPS